MKGRAGRKGKDEVGETYLCCHSGDLEAINELIHTEIPSVESCLLPEKHGIKRYCNCIWTHNTLKHPTLIFEEH
jgi:replicative superfamily II helicase